MTNQRPAPAEYDRPFDGYIARVPESDILAVLERQGPEALAALSSLSDERAGFRYASGKWSVREVIGHALDTERCFGNRAFSIARADPAPLPGFSENDYVLAAEHDRCTLAALVSELTSLRQSNVLMLRHLPASAWSRTGMANGFPVTVRALAYIMAGHLRHHSSVLAERYGIPLSSAI